MNYQRWDQSISWNKERVTSALTVCDAIYIAELDELTSDFNQHHGISWSTAQYEKLVGYWLRTFIHLLYDRWHGSSVGKPTQVLWDSRPAVDLLNCSSYSTSDLLNESLYWQLVDLRNAGQLIGFRLPDRLSFSSGYRIRGNTSAPIQIHNPHHAYGIPAWRRVLTLTNFPRKLVKLASPIVFRPTLTTSHRIESDWRLSRVVQGATDFPEACGALVRLHCPALYLEGFESMRSAAAQYPVNCLYTTTASDIPSMFLAAERHGYSRLLVHQHGGGYGIDSRSPNEEHERAISDRFYTWGWSEDATTQPLPVPPRISHNAPAMRHGILLRCVNYPRYAYKLQYTYIAGAGQVLIDRTIRFAKALVEHGLEISYYAHDYGWNVRQQFSDAHVHIPEQTKCEGAYTLHTCNYLGTAWLETLAANIPTICFYDPNINVFREAALPFIDELTRVGILHESPDSASDMVLGILDNPQEWWMSGEVQDARLAFVQRYARLEDGWLSAWAEEFSSMAKLAGGRG